MPEGVLRGIAYSLFGDNNGNIGIGITNPRSSLEVAGNISVGGSILPTENIQYDLGSSNNRWKDLYLSGNTLILGDKRISATATGIQIKDVDNDIPLDLEGCNVYASGSVGIGTTEPIGILHVEGTSYLNGTITTNNNNINVGSGTVIASIFSGTATQVSNTLTIGSYLTGDNFTGAASSTIAVDATDVNTASKVVARDGNGDFAARNITANLSGHATSATSADQVTSTLTIGSYLTGDNFNGSANSTIAVDATNANTASKIVARDGNGDFAARNITANLSGHATSATSADQVTSTLTIGSYLTGDNFNGSANSTIAVDATHANTASKVVVRDASGNFSAGTITADLSGTATQVSNTLTIGSYLTGDNFTGAAASTIAVDATDVNTASKVVARDGNGDFAARNITANLSGHATSATSADQVTSTLTIGSYLTGDNFNGSANSTIAVDATHANTASKVVVRDASGNFSAGTITADLSGTATQVSNTLTIGSYLTGDNFTGAAASTIAVDATDVNTASKVVARDGNGDFAARNITANLSGHATSATSADQVTSTLTIGSYLTGDNFNGSANSTIAVDATDVNTASKVVARDGNGDFAARNITANLSGHATSATSADQVTSTLTIGSYLTGDNFNGSANSTIAVDATDVNTASKVVARDGNGDFAARNITANLSGHATSATSADQVTSTLTIGSYLTGDNFNGSANSTIAVDATHANTASKVVVRDASGNFSAGTITADLSGTATQVSNTLTIGSYLTGDNFTGAAASTIAVDATDVNTASKVVARDGNGDFAARNITANLSGHATSATSADQVTSTLTIGSYLTGDNFNGSANSTIAVDATNANTASKIVARDASGNFSAGTITADLSGTATQVSNTLTIGSYLTGDNFTGAAASTIAVDATDVNTASKVVARDGNGDFAARNITANLSGHATSATSADQVTSTLTIGSYLTGDNFNGSANSTIAVDATNANTASKIVARDASGNFSAGTITADLSGTATQVSNTLTIGSYLTGDNFTGAAASTIAVDATDVNTASKVVARDGNGDFAARNITANLSGHATSATSADQVTSTLTIGSYLTGDNFNGSANSTIAVDATNANTASKIVARDASGNFSAGTITADLSGTATQVSNTLTIGSYLTGDNFTGAAASTIAVDATDVNTASKVVARDGNGDFAARNITANLSGHATSATSADQVTSTLTIGSYLTGDNFNGSANSTIAVDATNANTASKIVARDASGNFSAGTITADLSGTATQVSNTLTIGSYLTGDNFTGAAASTIAVDATDVNTASKVVARDGNGDFAARNITANLSGHATSATSADQVTSTLTIGSYLTGDNFNGSANSTIAVDATNANTASKIVARDASGNFSAGTITADLSGTATQVSNTLTIGSYLTGDNFTGAAASTIAVDATDVNTASKVVARDGNGDFAARNITANLSGHATSATSADQVTSTLTIGSYLTGDNFNGSANSTIAVDATNANTASKIVARDASGNFSAGTITADLSGTATQVSNTLTIGSYLTGDNFTGAAASTIAVDATDANTASKVVARDGNGDFAARNITANLSGHATSATSADQVTSTLTRGTYLTGSDFDGSSATTWAVDATTTSTASKIVARDASANIFVGGVGIGTNSLATYELNVVGDINFTGTLYQNGTEFVSGGGGGGGGGSSVWSTNSSDIYYTSGNVGIGTNSPAYTLDVNGTIFASNIIINNSNQYFSTANRLQVTPINDTIQLTSNITTFTYTYNGIYKAEPLNTDVSINGYKLAYSNVEYKDYDVTYTNDYLNLTSEFTITLAYTPDIDSIVDITIWPQYIEEGSVFGYSLQSFSEFIRSGDDAYYYKSGNVGIGTDTPTEKLHIEGTTYLNGNTTVGGTLGVTGASTLDSVGVTNNATVGGTLDVTGVTTLNGNVGIGTATPTEKLHVEGTSYLNGNTTIGGTLGVTGASTLDSVGVTNNATVGGTLDVTGVTTLNGNVGIGTTNNYGILHIYGDNSLPSIYVEGSTKELAVPYGEALQIGHWNSGTSSFTERIQLSSDGYLGINTGPSVPLHILQFGGEDLVNDNGIQPDLNSDANSAIRIELDNVDGDFWDIAIADNDNNLHFLYKRANRGYLNDSAYVANIDFTGQHRSISKNSNIDIEEHIGLIVSSSGYYQNLTSNEPINIPSIDESLPIVELSVIQNDKRVFGVISNKETIGKNREYSTGIFTSVYKKEFNETRLIINSLGEGGIWICNMNGNIENGDYITSSSIKGYGMRQNDDLLHNYTVAKITCDCDFDNIPYNFNSRYVNMDGDIITEEEYTSNLANNIPSYKAAFVGCTYHCG